MSDNENTKINDLLIAITRLETILLDYVPLTKMVIDHDKRLILQEQRCTHIQMSKTKINWGTVIASIISMVIGAAIISFMQRG